MPSPSSLALSPAAGAASSDSRSFFRSASAWASIWAAAFMSTSSVTTSTIGAGPSVTFLAPAFDVDALVVGAVPFLPAAVFLAGAFVAAVLAAAVFLAGAALVGALVLAFLAVLALAGAFLAALAVVVFFVAAGFFAGDSAALPRAVLVVTVRWAVAVLAANSPPRGGIRKARVKPSQKTWTGWAPGHQRTL